MKHVTIAALALGACSTTATAPDIDRTNAGILLGIETCHRNVIDGIPLNQAVAEAARGRKYERYDTTWPGSAITAPSWKLEGLVWVGLNGQGYCEIFAASGSGPEARKLALSTYLGMSSRRWMQMRVIPAPAGEVRDGVCTVDGMPPGKSVGVVMTSRADSNVTMQRSFVATVIQTDATTCTSRALS